LGLTTDVPTILTGSGTQIIINTNNSGAGGGGGGEGNAGTAGGTGGNFGGGAGGGSANGGAGMIFFTYEPLAATGNMFMLF
jgi:hypothetical protein